MRNGHGIFRDALTLAIDTLQGVGEVRGGDGRLGNGDLHLVLFGLEVELAVGLAAGFLVLLVLVLLLLVGFGRQVAEGADLAGGRGAGERGGRAAGGRGLGRARRGGSGRLVFVVTEGVGVCFADDFGALLGDNLLALGEFL